MGVDGGCQALAAVPPEKDPASIVYKAEGAPRPVWMEAENLSRTGI